MLWVTLLTLVSAAVAAMIAPALARRLPPATATVLLTGCALAVTAATAYALAVMAFTWIAVIPSVAAEGDWSPLLLRDENPVPAVAAVASAVVLLAGLIAATRAGWRRVRAYRRMRACLGGLPHTDGLVVLDTAHPDAYATPVRGGRIVVTQGMLAALQPPEVRAVIAHERAHLRRRHAWWAVAVDLCAAADPLLRPVAVAVADSLERWAAEEAAATVGDRRLVARALARAALRVHDTTTPATALAVVGARVPARVSAMLAPVPPRRVAPAVALLALLLCVGAATAASGSSVDQMFDSANVSATHHHAG